MLTDLMLIEVHCSALVKGAPLLDHTLLLCEPL